jgi:hypothetical protein
VSRVVQSKKKKLPAKAAPTSADESCGSAPPEKGKKKKRYFRFDSEERKAALLREVLKESPYTQGRGTIVAAWKRATDRFNLLHEGVSLVATTVMKTVGDWLMDYKKREANSAKKSGVEEVCLESDSLLCEILGFLCMAIIATI